MQNISALYSLGNTFSSRVCRELCPEGRTASWVALSMGDWVPGWQKRLGDGLSVPPVTTATDTLSPSKLRREGVLARVTPASHSFKPLCVPWAQGSGSPGPSQEPSAHVHPRRQAHICPALLPLHPLAQNAPCPSRLLLQTASKCRAVAAALSPLTLCLLRLCKNN